MVTMIRRGTFSGSGRIGCSHGHSGAFSWLVEYKLPFVMIGCHVEIDARVTVGHVLQVGAWELNALILLQLLSWVFLPIYIATRVCIRPSSTLRSSQSPLGNCNYHEHHVLVSQCAHILVSHCVCRGMVADLYCAGVPGQAL